MATRNATEIMKRRFGDTPERRKAIAEERARISAASLIYNARKKAGLSQQEMADKIGTTQSAISRLENTDYDGHTLSMLERIADALHLRLAIEFKPKPAATKNPSSKTRASALKARHWASRRRSKIPCAS